MSLFQPNLRKQIRKLPNILKSVKILHYYYSFVSLLLPRRGCHGDVDGPEHRLEEARLGPLLDALREERAEVALVA